LELEDDDDDDEKKEGIRIRKSEGRYHKMSEKLCHLDAKRRLYTSFFFL
jgi:hypothetical protein